MMRRMLSVAGAALLVLLAGTSAVHALPKLQLDIDAADAYYDTTTETVLTGETEFDVYAYLTPRGSDDVAALLADTYYVSIALIPLEGGGAPDGSVKVAGVDYDVTEAFIWGTPPVETLGGVPGFDAGDLSKHGIFDAYYIEVEVEFLPTQTTSKYNTQDTRFADGFDDTGDGMFYAKLSIDKSSLRNAELHFDLYNTDVKNLDLADLDRDDFAPFSHDAGTIPEPRALALFGLGSLIVGSAVRRYGR